MVPGSTAGTVPPPDPLPPDPMPPDPLPPDPLLPGREPTGQQPTCGGRARELHEGVREDDPMRMVACDLDGTIVRPTGPSRPGRSPRWPRASAQECASSS